MVVVSGLVRTWGQIRDKTGPDFNLSLCGSATLVHFVGCKWADPLGPSYLAVAAERVPAAVAILLVPHLRSPERRHLVAVDSAPGRPASLARRSLKNSAKVR